MLAGLSDRAGVGRSLVWGRLFARFAGRLAPAKYGGRLPQIWGQIWGRVWLGCWPVVLLGWPGAHAGPVGSVCPRSCPGRGKTGGFCNTFRKQNDTQTDTLPVRTRVYPVILYARTVILRPKKTIPLLRILEKKISKQKNVQTGWTQGEFSNPQGKFRNFLNQVMLIFLVIFYMIF